MRIDNPTFSPWWLSAVRKNRPKTADLHSIYTLVTLLYFSFPSNSFANDKTLRAAWRLTPDVTADQLHEEDSGNPLIDPVKHWRTFGTLDSSRFRACFFLST
jgi:hypothetical protein